MHLRHAARAGSDAQATRAQRRGCRLPETPAGAVARRQTRQRDRDSGRYTPPRPRADPARQRRDHPAGPVGTKSILSFKDQISGPEGMLVYANDFTIEHVAIEDSKGDGLKINDGQNITIRDVRVAWTGGPKTTNGAYGIYPVKTRNTLIEDSIAIGASDAGIYVGQSNKRDRAPAAAPNPTSPASRSRTRSAPTSTRTLPPAIPRHPRVQHAESVAAGTFHARIQEQGVRQQPGQFRRKRRGRGERAGRRGRGREFQQQSGNLRQRYLRQPDGEHDHFRLLLHQLLQQAGHRPHTTIRIRARSTSTTIASRAAAMHPTAST